MMPPMLEAENISQLTTNYQPTVGKGQDEAIADSKPKARPRADFNLGEPGVPIDGPFWIQNLDKCFWYGQKCYMAEAVDEPCDIDNAQQAFKKGLSMTFEQMQEWKCPPGM